MPIPIPVSVLVLVPVSVVVSAPVSVDVSPPVPVPVSVVVSNPVLPPAPVVPVPVSPPVKNELLLDPVLPPPAPPPLVSVDPDWPFELELSSAPFDDEPPQAIVVANASETQIGLLSFLISTPFFSYDVRQGPSFESLRAAARAIGPQSPTLSTATPS
jgi:hypothetical protein